MPGRTLAQPDALRGMTGNWLRGKAEVAEIPRTNEGGFAYRQLHRGVALGAVPAVKVI